VEFIIAPKEAQSAKVKREIRSIRGQQSELNAHQSLCEGAEQSKAAIRVRRLEEMKKLQWMNEK
jgi:hypothetical protein